MLIDKIIAATRHSIATTGVMALVAHDGHNIHRSPVAIREPVGEILGLTSASRSFSLECFPYGLWSVEL